MRLSKTSAQPPPAPAHGLYLAQVEYPPSAYEERPLTPAERGEEDEGEDEGEDDGEAGEYDEVADDEAAGDEDASAAAALDVCGATARAAQCTGTDGGVGRSDSVK